MCINTIKSTDVYYEEYYQRSTISSLFHRPRRQRQLIITEQDIVILQRLRENER